MRLVKANGLVGLLTPSGIYADQDRGKILQVRFHPRPRRRAVRL